MSTNKTRSGTIHRKILFPTRLARINGFVQERTFAQTRPNKKLDVEIDNLENRVNVLEGEAIETNMKINDLQARVTALENATQSGNISRIVNENDTIDMDTSFNVLLIKNTTGGPITVTLNNVPTGDLLEYKIYAITAGGPNTINIISSIRCTDNTIATSVQYDNFGSLTILYSSSDGLFFLLNSTGGDFT